MARCYYILVPLICGCGGFLSDDLSILWFRQREEVVVNEEQHTRNDNKTCTVVHMWR